jgi:hypothetical protein
LRDHIEKGDIEMKYIDTERQLADIFTKPHDATLLLLYGGNKVFAIPMAWFVGELVFYLVYTISYLRCIAFRSYLPNWPIASLIMLACILLTMLVCVRMS